MRNCLATCRTVKHENPMLLEECGDYYKGWARPGDKPSAVQKLERGGFSVPENETLDFLSGHYRIFQLKHGHRYSTDDVLTAWYGSSWCPQARRVLDLGSGIGSVGMIAAWRLPGAKFVTIEAQDESVRLARKSAEFNGLLDRYEIRHGDFRDTSILRPGELFDLVLGSPPYFPRGTGVESSHPQKTACRFELRGDIKDYCETASRTLASGGVFACIFPILPEHQAERMEGAARSTGLTIVRKRPVVLREGEPPLLSLFLMMASRHLPENLRTCTWSEPALIIRSKDGSAHPEYRAVKLAFGFPPN